MRDGYTQVHNQDLEILKKLLDEKISKIETLLGEASRVGGAHDYYSMRHSELVEMRRRLVTQ
ncbi:MAG: hypothetical protein EBR82_00010 [Caulobacteraceae bacterium]|nr:hypothetical protein [Caulobacteraceae bacterium]